MLHYPIAILVLRVLGQNSESGMYSFWQIFLPTAVITVIFSMFVNMVMKKTILKVK